MILPLRAFAAEPGDLPAAVEREQLSPRVEFSRYRFSEVPGVTQSVHVVRIDKEAMASLRFACDDRCRPLEHWEGQKLDAQRHARTLFGLDAQGRGYLVTVDAYRRSLGIMGMTYTESGAFMRKLGCRDALNLDGGASTYLYIRGRGANGLVMASRGAGTACPVSSVVGLSL